MVELLKHQQPGEAGATAGGAEAVGELVGSRSWMRWD